jgi:hypothetical protein
MATHDRVLPQPSGALIPLIFLGASIAGLLLAVRIMFFGAERRRGKAAGELPLRWAEPAIANFLIVFGIAGYLLTRHRDLDSLPAVGIALALGALWAAIASRFAIAVARIQPEHDPDDPRYLLQGHVAVVTTAIPTHGEGLVVYNEGNGSRTVRARALDGIAIVEGDEVCIERIEDDVAYVERWALVEARL